MNNNDRWGLLYCPKKGIHESSRRWERLKRTLDERGVLYDFVQSESTDSVERLMTMLLHNGYTTIIIVGGDSALNDAVNCLMHEEKSVRERVHLGLIPNGVMNDFARYWGFDEKNDAQTVDWLIGHRVRKIDLGRISYDSKDSGHQDRYFLNCVNIGLTADIMHLRRQARKVLGSSHLAFLSSLVLMLFHRHDYKMRIQVNYEEIDRMVMTVCIGSARGYGQTPSAVPYSGLLDVSVVYNPPGRQFLEGLWLLFTGRFLNHRSVHPYRTRELTCESAKARVGIDGRLAEHPTGEYHIRIEPEIINFLIPN
ncbi:MAG: lipid kinase [Prevotella sp.]|nr:lipid kinase [Prevotella sp.]